MIALGLLAAVIAAVVYGITRFSGRSTHAGRPEKRVPGAPALGAVDTDRLDEWVAAGLLSAAQAAAIRTHEAANAAPRAHRPRPAVPHAGWPPPTRRRRIPPAAEALGYLGGVLAITGVVLLIARYWTDLGTGGRLAVSGVGAAVLTLGGLLVRPDGTEPALERLQTFLWLLSSAATAVLATVVMLDVFDRHHAPTIVLGTAAVVAVQSGLLWRGTDRALQQATCLAGGQVAIAAAMLETGHHGATGLVLLAASAGLLALGVRHLLTQAVVATALGAVGVIAGGFFVADEWRGPGFVLLCVLGIGLVGLALADVVELAVEQRAVVGAVGSMALLQGIPTCLAWFAHDAGILTGLVVATLGVATILVAGSGQVRADHLVEVVGGLGVVGGVALTGMQSVAFATIAGLATACALVAVGTRPGRVLMSVIGSLGLMVNVPWTIGWFFPGQGRVPLLILVSGIVIVAVAVLLSRMGGRFRELRHHGAT